MPLKVYTANKFENTHERKHFNQLSQELSAFFLKEKENYYLIGNPNIGGRNPDALFIKRGGLALIELKDYGGSFTFSENGPWIIHTIDNKKVEIKGGTFPNPYLQVQESRRTISKSIKEAANFFINDASRRYSFNWNHISSVLAFSRPIEIDEDRIPNILRSWLQIVDMRNVCQRLEDICSQGLNFTEEEINSFIRFFFSNSEIFDESFEELTKIKSDNPFAAVAHIYKTQQAQPKPQTQPAEAPKPTVVAEAPVATTSATPTTQTTQANLSSSQEPTLELEVELEAELATQTVTKETKQEVTQNVITPTKSQDNPSLQEIENYLEKNNWTVIKHFKSGAKSGEFFPIDFLPSDSPVMRMVSGAPYDGKVYKHQYLALKSAKAGDNICLATSTASGKSLVFQMTAINLLTQNPQALVLALYPQKSLAKEQTERWQKAIQAAGLVWKIKVERIDGDVKVPLRAGLLRESQIIIMTPDVLHAWLLKDLAKNKEFVRRIALVIIDEVHTYTGVFGSNSAYLFRRLNHAVFVLSGRVPQYITASATINNPGTHLSSLTGIESFQVIDSHAETAPKHPVDTLLIESTVEGKKSPPVGLLRFLSKLEDANFLCFVDSRQQAERTAVNIEKGEQAEQAEENENTLPFEEEIEQEIKKLEPGGVMVYRAGYAAEDHQKIHEKLGAGELKGVICTSALELGLDIPNLKIVVLYGLPNSFTAYQQRIGRIGRNSAGIVLIVNDGSVRSETIFNKPDDIKNNYPKAESAHYLENPTLQMIHTLCFAQQDGEYDAITGSNDTTFHTAIKFPESFLKRCEMERTGQYDREYEEFRKRVQRPHFDFPLRDLERQWTLLKQVPHTKDTDLFPQLGTLGESQRFREAYPGAIYLHNKEAYRVVRFISRENKIILKRSKSHFTSPLMQAVQILPNFNKERIYESVAWGDWIITECDIEIKQRVFGFKERRGKKEIQFNYPLDGRDSTIQYAEYGHKVYLRQYPTSGVLFFHPILKEYEPKIRQEFAKLLYQVFLLHIPYEPQDVGFDVAAINLSSLSHNYFTKDAPFVALYDCAYRGLRLTKRLLDNITQRVHHNETTVLEIMIEKAQEVLNDNSGEKGKHLIAAECIYPIRKLLETLESMLEHKPHPVILYNKEAASDEKETILDAYCTGTTVLYRGEEAIIEGKPNYSPNSLQFLYKLSLKKEPTTKYSKILHDELDPIAGISQVALFDIEEGEFVTG